MVCMRASWYVKIYQQIRKRNETFYYLTANAYNFTLVPLYDSFGEEMLLHILNETRMLYLTFNLIDYK
jgi:hypothetical protein